MTVFNMLALINDTTEVTLHATPFGARRPSIPTAKTITIARIASPITTNRVYQAYFLQSLQEYFQDHPRLVKNGDVIVVPLDTDASRSTWKNDEKSESVYIRLGLDASSDR